MFENILQIPAQLPFETIERSTKSDWFGLVLFFTGILSLIILQYRNPNVLISLFSRATKNDTEKLYFSAPAIDSVDRIFLFVIYLCSTILSIHFFVESHFDASIRWVLYLLPVALLIFFTIPLLITAQLVGYNKYFYYLIRKQAPLLFLFGLGLLPVGGLIFVDATYFLYVQALILLLFLFVLVWLHFRMARALILEGFPFYFIFMYFCTLEILPIAFLWVWISRI